MEIAVEAHCYKVFRDHLAPVLPYLDDGSVQEIMINRFDDIWVEQGGSIKKIQGLRLTELGMKTAIRALAAANGRSEALVLDCRMTGLRVAAALYPVAIHGNAMSIRRHSRSNRRLEDYLNDGAFNLGGAADEHKKSIASERPADEDVAAGGEGVMRLLRWIIKARQNVIIAGATSSGKTTLLNALIAEMPPEHRLISIEDTAELQVGLPNYVGLETNEIGGVSVRNLVKLCLRFRPDRILLGEVRGGEAYDLVDALNTGHSGGACTLHAESASSALSRLETLMRMSPEASSLPLQVIREQIAQAFQFVIFASRFGGRRGPETIIEITGFDNGRYVTKPLFSRSSTGGHP